MGLLILYISVAVLVSFLCSIMEAVLLSTTPSYIAALEQEGSPIGDRLRSLKGDIDAPLAAILSLNTIANTVGAVGAGAQAAAIFGSLGAGIVSGILTLMILVFSEIIPKTLGAVYWRELSPVVAHMLRVVQGLMLPFVWMSKGITRLLASEEHRSRSVSREEFTALAELGHEEGVFQEEESRILRNLFRFSSLRVKDIMTPRTVVQCLQESQTIDEVVDAHEEFRFSRIPVFTETRDDISGYVLKDELLLKAAQDQHDETYLRDIKREMLVVPDTLPLPELFERLLDRLEHIALVVDEYGGTAGIVSMEDVVETLLGLEIVDEVDSAEDMQVHARRQWLRRARRLGIVPEELDDATDEIRDEVVRLGLTGSTPSPEAKGAEEEPSPEKVEDNKESA